MDGVTRPVERTGRTKGAAQNRLVEAIRDRVRIDVEAGEITADSTVEALAKKWYADGDWAETTTEQYGRVLDKHVIPGLGGVAVRKLTVGRCDTFLGKVEKEHGASTAKMVRSVLSGMASLACRHDALPQNPVREVSTIKVATKPTVAFRVPEARQILAFITYDPKAVRRDLPDLVWFMFATSLRIGEAVAFEWDDIDLDASTCTVRANVHRITGKGLVRNEYPNNKLKWRTLALPSWAVKMLRSRRERMPKARLVFPAVSSGGLRDVSNTGADLRDAFEFMGITGAKSHMFRKTGASLMDDHGRSPATSPIISATTRCQWPRTATSCETPPLPAPPTY